MMHLIGDVKDKDAIVIDDMIDTAGTLVQAVSALEREGARRIIAGGVHAVLSGPAVGRIDQSELDLIVVTDTIPLAPEARASKRIRQLSVAELLAETVRRIRAAESVSRLYLD